MHTINGRLTARKQITELTIILLSNYVNNYYYIDVRWHN